MLFLKKILNWLSNPYYFNPSIKFKLKASVLVGLFIFIFLYVFKPFYLYSLGDIILHYTFGIGFISFLSTFFFLYVPALCFKKYFNEDKWTIGKNLLLIIIGIFITGIVIWYVGSLFKNQFNIKKISLIRFLFYTYLVALIPIYLFIYINEKSIRERREKKVLEIKKIKREKEIKSLKKLAEKITITSENGKEKVTFNIDDLVYITSQGNYASFFLKDDNDLKEKILRVTLIKIVGELKEYSNIIKCHKSYIVNINYINDISGNARGYLLKSKFISFNIPVSRKFSKQSLQSLLG